MTDLSIPVLADVDHDLSHVLPPGYRDTVPERFALTAELAQRFPGRRIQIEQIVHGVAVLVEDAEPSKRPGAKRWPLSPGTRPADAERVAAAIEAQGEVMIQFSPAHQYAVSANLAPATIAVRDRIAGLLRLQPWDLELSVSFAVDEVTGRGRIDAIHIDRADLRQVDGAKRIEMWRYLIENLPGGSSGWSIKENSFDGTVDVHYGSPLRLPDQVSMAELLPGTVQPETWAELALGIDPHGTRVGLDLTLGPQTLVVGPTGSGKSVLLRQHIAVALASGHDVAIIDTMKGGADFLRFKAWTAAWGGTLIAAQAVLQYAYDEGQRRKALLTRYEAPFWAELPPEVRVRERVVPITVVIDEAMSMLLPMPEPKGLPKDHPEFVQAQKANSAKALALALIGKISRELRFVGVHLAIAMQRPDTGQLSGFGEIRSNLTSAIQLIKPGSMPASETLRMLFPGEQTHAAAETIKQLDDGTSKGLALVAADGGDVTGFRVAFTPVPEIPGLLHGIDLQHPPQWDLSALLETEPEPLTRIEKSKPQTPVETPALEFSLDDLDSVPDAVEQDEPDFSGIQIIGADRTPTAATDELDLADFDFDLEETE